MDFTFGGVEFSCTGVTSPDFSRTRNDVLPLDYTSFLVAKTYGASTELRQQVLDALSPFQLVSKAWAISTLRCYPIFRSLYYPGSWLGQLAIAMQSAYQKDYVRHGFKASHTLIDLDSQCSAVAGEAAGIFLADAKSKVLVQDIFDLEPPSEGALIVWTGLEHFDLDKVRRWIHQCPTGTTFLFQGTDMPAPDHVSPISSPRVLLHELEIYPTQAHFQGSLISSVGNRHQVTFTL